MKNKPLLFVYGTLRRACNSGAHQRYLRGARWLGEGRVRGQLLLVSYYPGLLLNDAGWVRGEVYELTDWAQLQALDIYEECQQPARASDEYRRESIAVELANGEELHAWAYLYQRDPAGLAVIASGDFLQRG